MNLYNEIQNVNATPEMYNKYHQKSNNIVVEQIDLERPITSNIRIIKNNYKQNEKANKEETIIFCEYCDSELAITKDDIHIGWLGAAHVTCPCCGEETMVEEYGFEGIKLTKDNIEFPKHFLRTNKNLRNVIEIYPEKIKKFIQDGIDFLRKNKDKETYYIHTGDMYLFIDKNPDDEEFNILVTKDFYRTDIPFEAEDYE